MRVKITRPTIAQRRQVLPGEELEVSQQEAIQLIGAHKAIALKAVEVETTDKSLAEAETSAAPIVPEAPTAPEMLAEQEVKPAPRGKKKASE